MVDDTYVKQLEDKVKILEQARDQLGKGWLTTEREKSRFSAVVDNLGLGFIMMDDQHKIVRKNPAVNIILGNAENGEWNLTAIQEKIEDSYDLSTEIGKCISERRLVGPADVSFDDKNIRLFLSPIILLRESIAIFGAVMIIEDITSQRKHEEYRDKFFAISSDNIKYPLFNLIANVNKIMDALKDRPNNDRSKAVMTNILVDATTINQVANSMEDIVKGGEEKSLITNEVFSMPDLIRETILVHEVDAKSKNISLKFQDIEKGFLKVTADRARVRQVLGILVENGIKYTEKGSVNISLTQRDNNIIISVSDTGHGVIESIRKQLFKKTKKPGQFPGTGLYLAKLLVNDLGGDIFLEKTEADKGSTFSFTLPLAYGL